MGPLKCFFPVRVKTESWSRLSTETHSFRSWRINFRKDLSIWKFLWIIVSTTENRSFSSIFIFRVSMKRISIFDNGIKCNYSFVLIIIVRERNLIPFVSDFFEEFSRTRRTIDRDRLLLFLLFNCGPFFVNDKGGDVGSWATIVEQLFIRFASTVWARWIVEGAIVTESKNSFDQQKKIYEIRWNERAWEKHSGKNRFFQWKYSSFTPSKKESIPSCHSYLKIAFVDVKLTSFFPWINKTNKDFSIL